MPLAAISQFAYGGALTAANLNAPVNSLKTLIDAFYDSVPTTYFTSANMTVPGTANMGVLRDGTGGANFLGTVTAPTFSGALSGNATSITGGILGSQVGAHSLPSNRMQDGAVYQTGTTAGAATLTLNIAGITYDNALGVPTQYAGGTYTYGAPNISPANPRWDRLYLSDNGALAVAFGPDDGTLVTPARQTGQYSLARVYLPPSCTRIVDQANFTGATGQGYIVPAPAYLSSFAASALGTTATATVTVSGGSETGYTITNPGSGYSIAPTVTFVPTSGGTGMAATAVLTNGAVTALTFTNTGSGYTTAPTVVFSTAAAASRAAIGAAASGSNADITAMTALTAVTGSVTLTGTQTFISGATGNATTIFKGLAGQTANLTEWRDSSNTFLAAFGPGGNLAIGGVETLPARRLFLTGTLTGTAAFPTAVGMTVQPTLKPYAAGAAQAIGILPTIDTTQGVVASAYGLYLSAGSITAGANAVTNAYGLFLQPPAYATNNYGLAVSGGTSGFGTSAPTRTVDVTGTIRAWDGGTLTADQTTGMAGGAPIHAARLSNNVASDVAGYFSLNTSAAQGAGNYEKAALYAAAWSADTGSAVRGSCGADIRAYVNTGNLTGAVWGAIIQAYNWGTVPGNTDGTLIGLEVQSANWRGTAPASPGVALQKLGVHIVAAGPAAEVWHSTCALWINGNNTTNAWHKGLYSTPSAYVDTTGATTDTFIELANTMWVKPTGAVWTTSGYAQGAAINPATRVHANALSTVGGTLSSTANNKVGMASFGAIAVGSNDINLGVYAARRSSGSDYTTAAVGFQYDVDASANVGGQLWLSQAGIGVGGYAAQNHIRQVNVFSQASIAPGAIAANSSVVFGVTTGVTGLTVGDPVAVGFSPALNNGLTAYATVTAANQINVTIHNATAGSITPATSTVKCIVIN